MREAARALDDVSDHLGEVLRHADELLADWGRFGGQVRAQVEREAAGIGAVVDDAVERAARSGIDRAIGDRLRALTGEIERLEQRARAASRVVTEQRDADRRILWVVVAGILLANALLVVLLLRKPDAAALPAPRIDAPVAVDVPVSAGSGVAPSSGATTEAPGPSAPSGAAADRDPTAGSGESPASGAGASSGSALVSGPPVSGGGKPDGLAPPAKDGGGAKPAGAPVSGPPGAPRTAKPADVGASVRPAASPVALPPKAGARAHKKLP